MATSIYFNHYKSKAEQRLQESLITESIKVQGFDGKYIPNVNDAARDLIYGEDPLKKFTTTYPLEMYLSTSEHYEGAQTFFSKFNLEVRNNVSVVISKRSFAQRVPQTYSRPREGDLIYVDFLNGTGELFEITFVDKNPDFFALGHKSPYFYEIRLERFKYSQEVIATGTPEIDQVVADSGYNLHLTMGTGSGEYEYQEYVFQSPDGTAANSVTLAMVQTWYPGANTLTVSNINGEFVDDMVVIGMSSNAQYMLNTFDPMSNPSYNSIYDNEELNIEAEDIVVTTQNNAIGTI